MCLGFWMQMIKGLLKNKICDFKIHYKIVGLTPFPQCIPFWLHQSCTWYPKFMDLWTNYKYRPPSSKMVVIVFCHLLTDPMCQLMSYFFYFPPANLIIFLLPTLSNFDMRYTNLLVLHFHWPTLAISRNILSQGVIFPAEEDLSRNLNNSVCKIFLLQVD